MDINKDLAQSFASYLDINLKDELQVVECTVDEMLTRLDEFENVLNLLRSDRALSTDEVLPNIVAFKPALNELFGRVDKLETIVNRVEEDVTRVETAVQQAETDLGSQNVSSAISSFLKPIFFKKTAEPVTNRPQRQCPEIDPDSLFNTDDFFRSAETESSV